MLGPVARNIIRLWYVAIWYELPKRWKERFGGIDGEMPEFDETYVVSPAAYTEGLLWRAIGAHPAGAKAPGYGEWAEPPIIDGHPEVRPASLTPLPRGHYM
jgi:hypothetical protein